MKWLTELPIFDLTYILLIFSGLILSLIFNKNLESSLKLLPLFCTLYLILELVSAYISSFTDNNHFIYHIFSPIDYGMYCIIYFKCLKSVSWSRYIIYSIPFFFILSSLISYSDGFEHTTSKLFLLRGCIISFFVLMYFKTIIENESVEFVVPRMFWFSSVVLFYFVGKTFISGFMDTLIKIDLKKARDLYYAGYIFNYLVFFMVNLISVVPKFEKK